MPVEVLPVELDFALGEVVYHRMADERRPGLVTGVLVTTIGVMYLVTWGCDRETRCHAIELTREYVPSAS